MQFFDSSVEFLSSIVSTLLSFDEWNIYIIDFLTEYGVPLWNHTYVIEGDNDNLYFVPLYKGENYNAINSFWVFYVSDGKMTYAPFKHDNSSEEDEALIFMCNLLSYRVFGEDNANNIIMKELQAGSRAWISVEQCWDIWTGTEGNLEYQYTTCISKPYWIDETKYRATMGETGGGSGTEVPIDHDGNGGSGSNGNSTSAGSSGQVTTTNAASKIFKGENLSEDSWSIINYLLNEIMDNCMGENLYNQIMKLLNGEKIDFKFIDGDDSGYNWYSRILKINIEYLDSDILLHEMMHIYQTLVDNRTVFEGALLNREIEAHYAQYLFSTSQRKYRYGKRWDAIKSLRNFIDPKGNLRDNANSNLLSAYVEFQIVPIFQMNDTYKNYQYNNKHDGLWDFSNIKSLTINCN